MDVFRVKQWFTSTPQHTASGRICVGIKNAKRWLNLQKYSIQDWGRYELCRFSYERIDIDDSGLESVIPIDTIIDYIWVGVKHHNGYDIVGQCEKTLHIVKDGVEVAQFDEYPRALDWINEQ